MNELLPKMEIERIASAMDRGAYEGYPSREHRLYLGSAALQIVNNTLIVPDGPWYITNHKNRQEKRAHLLDPEVPSEEHPFVAHELRERWLMEGLLVDQYGRPIHPNWEQLLGDERIGLPTGLGFFWRYGANATVDALTYRQYYENSPLEILLIKRRIGEQWALPGGFIDRDDASAVDAARREAKEETHLDAIGGTDEIMLHRRPIGRRDTLHAWTENTVVMLHGDQDYLYSVAPIADDDAIDVGWFTREQMAYLDMFDVHLQYIDTALHRLSSLS